MCGCNSQRAETGAEAIQSGELEEIVLPSVNQGQSKYIISFTKVEMRMIRNQIVQSIHGRLTSW